MLPKKSIYNYGFTRTYGDPLQSMVQRNALL